MSNPFEPPQMEERRSIGQSILVFVGHLLQEWPTRWVLLPFILPIAFFAELIASFFSRDERR